MKVSAVTATDIDVGKEILGTKSGNNVQWKYRL